MKLHHHWLKACDCQVIANEDAVSFCVFADGNGGNAHPKASKRDMGDIIYSYYSALQFTSQEFKSQKDL